MPVINAPGKVVILDPDGIGGRFRRGCGGFISAAAEEMSRWYGSARLESALDEVLSLEAYG